MRRLVIALWLGTVAVAACSSDNSLQPTPETSSAPPGTAMSIEYTHDWKVSSGLGEDEDLVAAELQEVDAFALVPPPSADTTDATGELQIRRSVPFDVVYVDVTVRAANGDVVISASGTWGTSVSCDERLDGVGGLDGWWLLDVRSTPGCAATNTPRLSFIEWTEDGARWSAETGMDPDAAVAWLAQWTVLA